MVRTILSRMICWALLLSLAVVFATTDSSVLFAGPVKKAVTKRVHRLPRYYAKVVNEGQRAAIYAIQDEYASQIAELASQLKALKAERNEKIKAVLTAEQQQQVEETKKQRAALRAAKRAGKTKKETPPVDRKPKESRP